MDFMLSYHAIHHPDTTYLTEKISQYVMNEVKDDNFGNDLQVTLKTTTRTQHQKYDRRKRLKLIK